MTLIQRLRAAARSLRSFYKVGAVELIPAGTMEEAADTLDRVREALQPFAKAAAIKLCGGDYWTDGKSIQGTDVASYITFGDLKLAAATLAELGDGR